MNLKGGCFYLFIHVLVKLEGRVGHHVDCCYTKSELSVMLTDEKTVKFVVKLTCTSPIVLRDGKIRCHQPCASQCHHDVMFLVEYRMKMRCVATSALHGHATVQPTHQTEHKSTPEPPTVL